jgi:plastocyanin
MRPAYAVFVLALLGADPKPTGGGTVTGTAIAIKNGQRDPKHKDVYVYLVEVGRKRHRGPAPGDGQKFEIRQTDRHFVPEVLIVPVGATVAFPNYDRELHNVWSPTDPPFQLGSYNTDKKGRAHVFADTDEFDIFCDIHSDMAATVKVVDTRFFAPVKDGTFTLEHVPPGRYKVVAWTPDSPESSEEVVVTEGGVAKTSELHVQVSKRSRCHRRRDGSPYPARYSPCPAED